MAKALLTEIVPRWGIPRKISSDNGRHFVNDAIKQVGQFLGIDMRTHCSYAPSSGGAVERQNQTIKNKLAKCCEETGLTWLKALPIVLMYMRMRKRVKTNLSPFEILFGRPPFMGIEGGKQRLPSMLKSFIIIYYIYVTDVYACAQCKPHSPDLKKRRFND